MRRFALIVALAIFASFFWGTAAFAHGTDLNNVWTTEVLDQGTFEWDVDLGISNDQFTSYWSEDGRFLQNEFYSTILPNFEIGFAFNLEREAGPWIMFAKYKVFDENADNFPVSLAVGCDNIIGTHARTSSEPIPWVVIGKEFNKFKGYVGYAHNASGVQGDSGIIGGIDYTINPDWWFQADYYGFNDSSDALISGGIYRDLINHMNLGVFGTYDTVTTNTVITVEMAFSGRYDDLKATP
jgi:hypothetical protein